MDLARAPQLARRQVSDDHERNEPEGRLFILRCNISRIVPDFVHARLSAYDDRSLLQETLPKIPYP